MTIDKAKSTPVMPGVVNPTIIERTPQMVRTKLPIPVTNSVTERVTTE